MLTRPSSYARLASTGSPVRTSSIATWYGIRTGSRKRPPAAAASPRLTSGMPNFAVSAAIDQVASQDDLAATRKRPALDGSDQRLLRRSEGEPGETATRDMRVLAAHEGLEIHAGAERAVRAGEDAQRSARGRRPGCPWPPAIPSATALLIALRACGRLMVTISTLPRRSVRTGAGSAATGVSCVCSVTRHILPQPPALASAWVQVGTSDV